MKRILFIVGALLMAELFPINTGAMTSESKHDRQESGKVVMAKQSDTIYLLSWQENKLLTTKGTFVTDGIQVVNESGIEKDRISLQNDLPIVQLVKENDVIIKIIILPSL